MRYQKVNPAPHLAPFVECYFVWEKRDLLVAPLHIESPPTGFASMVFTCGDPYRVRTCNGTTEAPMAFLTGQATRQYELELLGRIDTVGIVFRPAGMNTLFGLPMYDFTDQRVSLADILGPSVTYLHEQLKETPSAPARMALLEGFLNQQLLRRGNRLDRTDFAANLLVNTYGTLTINELMKDLYVCRRQFERQFLNKVGISPKYYTRIRRVGHVCAQLATQRWQLIDWQDFVFQAGYYDQSHFIRDFSQITGKKPTIYVKDNAELSQYL